MTTNRYRDPDERTFEWLPTPGAVKRDGNWLPTLDGEPIPDTFPFASRTREDAWREALTRIEQDAGLEVRLRIGVVDGGVEQPDAAVVVTTVRRARQAVLNHLTDTIPRHPDPRHWRNFMLDWRKFIHDWGDLAVPTGAYNWQLHHWRNFMRDWSDGLVIGSDEAPWKFLETYVRGRRYDPDTPEAGMTCTYVLFAYLHDSPHGDPGQKVWHLNCRCDDHRLGGGAGAAGPYPPDTIVVEVTGPPKLWDHPDDLPCGLDPNDDAGVPSG